MPPQVDPGRPKTEPQDLTADEENVYNILLGEQSAITAEQLLGKLPGKSLQQLGAVLNQLLSKTRIDPISISGQPLMFKAKTPEEVVKYANMDTNEMIIYGHIKNAGNKGIWIKDLKQKSNIHTKNVQDAIKSLEKNKYIKSVKSVKNPIKKVYMLYELDPSEEVSGGTWYTDNEFDQEFIAKVSEFVEKFVYKYSFPHDSDDAIHPPGYNKYPSLLKIVAYLELNKLTTTSLAEDDIQAILDKLIYDGKIERKGTAQTGDDEDDTAVYKAIRDRHGNKTAWTEIPCGTCPVYDQCDDEGPITPESCEYIKKWLAF